MFGRGSRSGRRRTAAALAATALATGLLSACSGGGGVPTLTWYINPDVGAQGQALLAKQCSTPQYRITTQLLPNSATDQRQQLVQRLSAKDSSIDIMSGSGM